MSALKSLGPRPPGAFPPSRRSLNLLRERLVGAMSREWLGKFLFSELNNRQISMPKTAIAIGCNHHLINRGRDGAKMYPFDFGGSNSPPLMWTSHSKRCLYIGAQRPLFGPTAGIRRMSLS
ncbi:hypothetical protein Ac2012v2_007287 [Leucoagaricus gongylophorus]